jgi:hypothetical protein
VLIRFMSCEIPSLPLCIVVHCVILHTCGSKGHDLCAAIVHLKMSIVLFSWLLTLYNAKEAHLFIRKINNVFSFVTDVSIKIYRQQLPVVRVYFGNE